MNRDELIDQVKDRYAHFANTETQDHFHQTAQGVSPEAYYESLLNMVTDEISAGTFDSFSSGDAIVAAVANDKQKWLSKWGDSNVGFPGGRSGRSDR